MLLEEPTYRSFGGGSDSSNRCEEMPTRDHSKSEGVLASLHRNIVGQCARFVSPFGSKPIVYADWTASGRALKDIERYLQDNVMSFYGNTHTSASITGHQSSCYRNESRQIIAESVNARITGKAAEDVVLFVGNGCTAAVSKIVSIFDLNIPVQNNEEDCRPVVFVSCYEHHSNLLPWRESVADVVVVAYDVTTGVDLVDLERLLVKYSNRRLKIGTFSAASNVTGLCTDVVEVSVLLHKHGALAFFDYATAAPYVKVDMNPVLADHPHRSLAYKDAVFFSGHKFLGGPGSPGVLVIKKRWLPQSHERPSSCIGGGTVFYVTEEHHRYLSNREEREEGGTADLLSDVKMGLAVQVKQQLGAAWIEDEELRISAYVQSRLEQHQSVVLLGRCSDSISSAAYLSRTKHLPIFSLLLRYRDRFLHFHFVTVLLNDLFGVQSRGGCVCAGPFAQLLLGIRADINREIEKLLLEKHEVYRPGFTRVSFPYWTPRTEIDYVIDAILFVAEHGFKFLSMYRYNHKTGEWAHSSRLTKFPERRWISNFSILDSNTEAPHARGGDGIIDGSLSSSESIEGMFNEARKAAALELQKIDQLQAKTLARRLLPTPKSCSTADAAVSSEVMELYRWFAVADDVASPTLSLYPIIGPIEPISVESMALRSQLRAVQGEVLAEGDVRAAVPLSTSAYAARRDQQLVSHTGAEGRKPRYLNMERSPVRTADRSVGFEPLRSVSTTGDLDVLSKVVNKVKSLQSGDLASSAGGGIVNKSRNAGVSDEAARETDCPAGISIGCSSKITSGANNLTKILSGSGTVYNSCGNGVVKAKTPPKKILKHVGQAIKEWGMIEDGDRLLLGLSGGKDSLALLHVLIALQKKAPISFTIACATVDPQTDSFDPSPLIPYVQSLGITYHYLSEPIVELAKTKLQGDSLCAFCARFKRGLLYSCCRNFHYNKLVLAQHLDDLVESFLMSALHNGQIRTMKANYKIEAGDVSVIRPLIYVREKDTRDFSLHVGLPVINENCPACFEQPKERARLKKLMQQEETMVPNLFFNLKRALMPLMHSDTYEAMDSVNLLIEAAGASVSNRERIAESVRRKRQLSTGESTLPSETVLLSATDRCEEGAKRTRRIEGPPVDNDSDGSSSRQLQVDCSDGYCAPCFELM